MANLWERLYAAIRILYRGIKPLLQKYLRIDRLLSTRSNFFRDPEAAVVGKISNLGRFTRELVACAIVDMSPACCRQVREDFGPIRQMHEGVAGLVGEV